MMPEHARLPNHVFSNILIFLKSIGSTYVNNVEKTKRFLDGVFWISRSGAQWRFLPEEFGNWNSVFKRFSRWTKKNIWVKMHKYFANDPDMESIMIDGTVVRAHACAAGMVTPSDDQALGRSKGGFSTKIHVMVEGVKATYAIMDKAYDADKLIEQLEGQGIIPVMPPKSNRKEQRHYDKQVYKERHLVECFIGKIKHFRRVFSRFEKTSENYMSFVRFASSVILMR